MLMGASVTDVCDESRLWLLCFPTAYWHRLIYYRTLTVVPASIEKAGFSLMQRHKGQDVAALDMDATLVETNKDDALFCYDGYKAYQPLSTWWAEQGVVVHTEFRDGNVPSGFEQLRVLKEALKCMPEGVKKVWVRSDAAGYQHDLLKYCVQIQLSCTP